MFLVGEGAGVSAQHKNRCTYLADVSIRSKLEMVAAAAPDEGCFCESGLAFKDAPSL